jgi:hypothetical protein
LRDGRLIDPSAGSLDKFCIELAMVDTGLSRHGPDEGTMLISQFVLLVMERHRQLCYALALAGWFRILSTDQGIHPGYPM